MDSADPTRLSELSAEIVGAFVSNNSLRPDELTTLIADVHAAFVRATSAGRTQEPPEPAAPIQTSVKPNYILCLEDGKKFRSLKRHLTSEHGTTPAEYRSKWSLSSDYPMVAPNYAKARSELAKSIGLGRKTKTEVISKTAPRPSAKNGRKANPRSKSRRRSKKATTTS